MSGTQDRRVHRMLQALRWLTRMPVWATTTALGAGIAVVAALDWLTGPDLSPLAGYLVPVAVAAWTAPRPLPDVCALLGALAGFAVALGHPDAGTSGVIAGNAAFRFAFLEAAVLMNVTLRDMVEVLDAHSRTDPLTGLLNRRGLDDALRGELAAARRRGTPLSVQALDLDGLKRVNDRDGHAAGDRMICAAADVMRRHARAVDHVARVGGDEYIVVLPDTDEQGARRQLQRMVADPRCPPLTCGSASLREDDGPQELLDRADLALVAAKRDRLAI